MSQTDWHLDEEVKGKWSRVMTEQWASENPGVYPGCTASWEMALVKSLDLRLFLPQ